MSRFSFYLVIALIVLASCSPSAKAADQAGSTQRSQRAGSTAVSPVRLVCTPTSLRFGKVAVGDVKTQFVTIRNLGRSSLILSEAIANDRSFGFRGLDFPLVLAGGESFTFATYFAPNSKGDATGRISFRSGVGGPVANLALSGIGTAAGLLIVAPSPLNFGKVRVGAQRIQTGTIFARNAPVTIFSASSSSAEFAVRGVRFPLTIPAGEWRQFTAVFRSRAGGDSTAIVSFESNAANSPTVESLTGVVSDNPTGGVYLSWNASPSHHVVGYNVYRSTTPSGPYVKVNDALDRRTSYLDVSATVSHLSYYYVTTAVNEDGQESGPSNQVSARFNQTQ